MRTSQIEITPPTSSLEGHDFTQWIGTEDLSIEKPIKVTLNIYTATGNITARKKPH